MLQNAARDIPRIVSVDDHAVEPPHLWQHRLPAALRERGPRVVRSAYEETKKGSSTVVRPAANGPESDFWLYDGVIRHIPQVTACAGYPPESLHAGPISFAEMRPGCYDPRARVADMDLNHTEASLCFPNYSRFCGQTFLDAHDRELALLCVRAYNDWMVEEWCGDSGGRLLPLCIIPLWDPGLAATEVVRNAERGCRALAFSELPTNLGLPSIHDRGRHWDPLFRACEETGTVVCMHIGSGSKMAGTSDDAPAGVGIALTAQNAQLSMVDWLFSGALVRYPRLRIAYSEAQIGWMPFLLERVDQVYRKSFAWAELDPAIDDLPSSYFRGRVYGCFFDDTFGLSVRDTIGIEQITFEIDYPHQDSTWPNSRAVVESFAPMLTDAELCMIVRDNAYAMLGVTPATPVPSRGEA
jgi:predicted TIM-barrel fold metal-dependent hydrolase